MNVREEIKAKLEKYPHVQYEEGENSIIIYPVNEEGFIIEIEESPSSYTVAFDGWHESFQSAEEALNYVAFGLTESCRLKIVLRGGSPQKWVVESKENNEWVSDSETGLFIFPFWRKTKVVYKQNHLIKET